MPLPREGPTFDVVSIKRNAGRFASGPPIERPDGGIRLTRVPVGMLIARAYPPAVPGDIIGLPEWARTEYYDVSATSTLSRATAEDRAAMFRAMLADRFKLAAHAETRDEPVYDLVLARADGKLGPRIKPIDTDCAARLAADRAAADAALAAGEPPPVRERPDPTSPPKPCTLRMVNTSLEGDTTMAGLAATLFRGASGRPVVDKTGLTGYFHVIMTFDLIALRRGPDTAPAPDAAPTIFTAVQEDLGLKLQPSHAVVNKLVIDHIERPTEN